MGTARAEGPGQEGMPHSGGRPMFRTEQQELSKSEETCICGECQEGLAVVTVILELLITSSVIF